MNLAPIVLFVYKRPWHTLQTLQSLEKNIFADQSTLFIYSDGPKDASNFKELAKIQEVRQIIKSKKWCKSVIIKESKTNIGLAESVLKGIKEIINEHEKIIVLEDDIVTSNEFLKYMNEALCNYENYPKVMSVSGYSYPLNIKSNNCYFINFDSSWGWGTWKRAWNNFIADTNNILYFLKDKESIYRFNFSNSYNFYNMLLAQHNGKIDSWSIRWYASIFIRGGLTLFPPKSLVDNIGHDGSGTHSYKTRVFDNKKQYQKASYSFPNPDVLEEDYSVRSKLVQFFNKTNNPSFVDKILFKLNKLKTLLNEYSKK